MVSRHWTLGESVEMIIEKVEYVWMDGRYVAWDEARVHVMTHALHYGTGVFEGVRGYAVGDNLYVFRLEDHLKRLYDSAKVYFMDIPYAQSELKDSIINLLKKNRLKSNCYIRPIVYRGFGEFGLNPLGSPVNCAVIAFPIGSYLKETGVRVRTSSWRRTPDECLPSAAKTCGAYVNSVLAKVEAVKSGYDEAILLDGNGYLAEGTGENIFIVKDHGIYTPPLSSSILEGVTRRTVINLAEDEGYRVLEVPLLKSELYRCDEAFFTGTAAEITPILQVDDRKVGDGSVGEVTSRLQRLFKDVVAGKVRRYRRWLTKVY